MSDETLAVGEPDDVAQVHAVAVPNRADAAWDRLLELREQARTLGITVDDRWPIAQLEEEIAKAS